MAQLIPVRKRTIKSHIKEVVGVLAEVAFLGLLAWVVFQIIWFFI